MARSAKEVRQILDKVKQENSAGDVTLSDDVAVSILAIALLASNVSEEVKNGISVFFLDLIQSTEVSPEILNVLYLFAPAYSADVQLPLVTAIAQSPYVTAEMLNSMSVCVGDRQSAFEGLELAWKELIAICPILSFCNSSYVKDHELAITQAIISSPQANRQTLDTVAVNVKNYAPGHQLEVVNYVLQSPLVDYDVIKSLALTAPSYAPENQLPSTRAIIAFLETKTKAEAGAENTDTLETLLYRAEHYDPAQKLPAIQNILESPAAGIEVLKAAAIRMASYNKELRLPACRNIITALASKPEPQTEKSRVLNLLLYTAEQCEPDEKTAMARIILKSPYADKDIKSKANGLIPRRHFKIGPSRRNESAPL